MKCKFERSVIRNDNKYVFLIITELQEKKLEVVFVEWCKFSDDEKSLLCEIAKRVPDVADIFICGKTLGYKIVAVGVDVPNTVTILLEKK